MAVMEPTVRVASQNVLKRYLKKHVDATVRKYAFMAGLQAKKRITFNNGTHTITWPVVWRKPSVTTNSDMQAITPTRDHINKWASLPFRSYVGSQAISKWEKLVARGPEVMFNSLEQVIKKLAESMVDTIALDLMNNDGNSATSDYGERVHGWPSWMGDTGSAVADAAGTGYVYDPDDLYADLYTNLGYYGSSTWSPPSGSEWPVPSGSSSCDVEYMFWSPFKVKSTADWGATDTWAAAWTNQLRFGKMYLEIHHRKKLDAWLVAPESYRQALDSQETYQQVQISRDRGGSTFAALGFEGVTFDGVDMSPAYEVPTGYKALGICWDAFELMSMQGQLVARTEDTDFDTNQTQKVAFDAFLQLKCESPAYTVAVY